MHVFRPHTDLSRVLVALAPLIGAVLIAISRLEDYRHDFYDVTVGSLLGISVALFSYKRYFHGLKSARCDIPYLSRAERANPKLKDEESRLGVKRDSSGDSTDEEAERVPLQEPWRRGGSSSRK